LIIELPVPRGIFVWRVQDGAFEEAIVHSTFSHSAGCSGSTPCACA
jgi:hypothetical protein